MYYDCVINNWAFYFERDFKVPVVVTPMT